MKEYVLSELEENLIILNIHAPTKEKENEIKDDFYDKIRIAYDKTPKKKDIKIILGDMNAKIYRNIDP